MQMQGRSCESALPRCVAREIMLQRLKGAFARGTASEVVSNRRRPVDKDFKTDPLSMAGAPVTVTIQSVSWVVTGGPQQGAEFRTEGEPIGIGSAPDNALVLDDHTVSRHHAEVLAVAEGFLLRDRGSTNGTFLDGHRVKEAFLTSGCQVRFGGTSMVFQPRTEDLLVPPESADTCGGLLGRSLAMRQLFGVIRRVASSEVSVVLWGETGTGKEVAARAIHEASRRADGPFAVLDGSALDRDLISSELFGHEAGAFTGAVATRQGAFELAQGGTLFLDEVGELPLDLQPKLLRALEQREIKRLGGTRSIRIHCRVIAATHRDLMAMVREGRFRQDLYYRLAQVVVRIPPLRDRGEDVPLLAERFLARAAGSGQGPTRFSPAALALLARAELPGNVRELRNVVERACAMAAGGEIMPDDLQLSSPPGATPPPPAATDAARARGGSLEDAEREAILSALKTHHWHRTRAASQLGISLPTLREKMRRFGIKVPERGEAP
jgi:DNA-binding NtrC family response regulator